MGEKTILSMIAKEYKQEQGTLPSFLLGIAGIPHNAKSACNRATSDTKPESSEQENSQLKQRSG